MRKRWWFRVKQLLHRCLFWWVYWCEELVASCIRISLIGAAHNIVRIAAAICLEIRRIMLMKVYGLLRYLRCALLLNQHRLLQSCVGLLLKELDSLKLTRWIVCRLVDHCSCSLLSVRAWMDYAWVWSVCSLVCLIALLRCYCCFCAASWFLELLCRNCIEAIHSKIMRMLGAMQVVCFSFILVFSSAFVNP